MQDVEEGLVHEARMQGLVEVHSFVEQNDAEYRQWKVNQTSHGHEDDSHGRWAHSLDERKRFACVLICVGLLFVFVF